jgi:2-polyprenyl-3-methyl-5-hydroxy-6-metoxy-1,4-benzoquinol methylase
MTHILKDNLLLEKYEIGREFLDVEILKKIQFKDNLDILEIGAFSGRLLKKIKAIQPNVNIFGVDIDYEATEYCKKLLPDGQFFNCDFITFASDKRFDYIIASQVLEHCINPTVFIFTILEYLKIGGTCIITVPNAKTDRCKEHCNFWTQQSFVDFFADRGIIAEVAIFDNKYNMITTFNK